LENRIDLSDNLFPLSNSDDSKAAHFIIALHEEGCERFFRHDLPLQIRNALGELDDEQALFDPDLVKSILAEDKPCEESWSGKGYVFGSIPDSSEFPDVLLNQGNFVVMVEKEPVAWAWSQEGNDKVAELAVEVQPEFRRRGYGRQVAAAWANHVMQDGRNAFYSHLHDNISSEALAQSLGVIQYAVSAGYN
jgi:ribosomal protein S18 acetylase RimI-like enzyme